MTRALIAPFKPAHLPNPHPRDNYNDDIALPFYTSSARTYAGNQRKGIQEEHLESLSIEEHVGGALSSPFFLSLETPIPRSITEALKFISDTPSEMIALFRCRQLDHLTRLVADAADTDSKWNLLIPSSIIPAAGRIRLAPPHELDGSIQLGGLSLATTVPFRLQACGRSEPTTCFSTFNEAPGQGAPGPSQDVFFNFQTFRGKSE